MWLDFFHSDNALEIFPKCMYQLSILLILSSLAWYGCTLVCWTIYLCTDIWVVSDLKPIPIKLLRTFTSFCMRFFSSKSTVVLFFFGNYRLIFIRNYQTVIWKGCATWPSHQKSWEYHFFILTSIYYCYFFFL